MKQISIVVMIAILLTLAACSGGQEQVTPVPSPTRAGQLTPYLAQSATPSPTIRVDTTPTPLPSPTPTPRTHTVALGEDLFGISLKYRVTVNEILKLNPDVQAQFLKVGTVLKIPAPSQAEANVTPQPTPISLPLSAPDCYATSEGGVWCFALASNNQEFAVESLAAEFRIAGEDGTVQSQAAFAALNHVEAAGQLPVMAYFSPPAPQPEQASVELSGGLPMEAAGRYVPVTVAGQVDELSSDGLSAQVSGQVTVGESELPAQIVWVAAAGFDAAGRLVGVRRYEQSGLDLSAGQSQNFSFTLYSAGGPIERVEFWAEAQP